MVPSKRIFVMAGPNGSGKTTTTLALDPKLFEFYEFINADEIARGLAPLHPESVALTASKLMLLRLRELLKANKSIAFETTAAGTNYIKYLNLAKQQGYLINLIFLWLSTPDLAVERVARRVVQGGHFVPEVVVRKRYFLGLKNLLNYYLPIADHALMLDNSSVDSTSIIAKKTQDGLIIKNPAIWEEIKRSINVSR